MSRQRLSAQESRAVALEAARTLLLEQGPHSVTLKAVAARVNRTHANLLHHFGSATGLQMALANYLATTICEEMEESKRSMQTGDFNPRSMVDFVFDTFGSASAGALAAWMLCTGHKGALDPILEAVHELIDECLPNDMASAGTIKRRELTYSLVLMALGEALMGEELARPLAVDQGAAVRYGEDLLTVALNARAQR